MQSKLPSTPSSSPEILRATWRDIKELRNLEQACFSKDAWPLIDLIGVLSFAEVVRIKAMVNNRMVGFIAGDMRGSQDLAWIATLGVLPAYRRRGIGSMLLQACENALDISQIRLSVRAKNLPALSLYRLHGYQRVGLWPDYYDDGTDAIVLEKHIQ
ncbi:MAG: GNAT family N-acetyltransferase [Chloroflexota bacterium]|nr:GNAT family N-acetyltransferase [Chloroflexota bacterium]